MSEEIKKEEEVTETPAVEVVAEAPVVEEAAAPIADDSAEEGEEVEVPAEFKALVEQVENMTVLELNSLVKLLEKKFGVSAAAVAVAGGGAGAAEEKTEFDVILESDGGAKIPVMKAVKELLGLGLKEAKEFVESAPATLKEGLSKEEADAMKAKIEDVGGKVSVK